MDAGSKVVVVGQSYAGLLLAVRAAEVGHNVIGYDNDAHRIKRIAAGEAELVEAGAAQSLAAVARSGRYVPSNDPSSCADFDVAVISVPTPLRDGYIDLSYIEDAAAMLGTYLRRGATVILESTTYPGTTDELLAPVLEEVSQLAAGLDFHVGYSPERLDPGNDDWTLENIPKVVSGIDSASLDSVLAFYTTFIARVVVVSGCKEAELSKVIENNFRHVSVAMLNEICMVASNLGIDVWESIDAASTKPFGYLRFTPGPGVGSRYCLPIDPTYLARHSNVPIGFPSYGLVETANRINSHMPEYVVLRLLIAMNRQSKVLRESRILLLGLSYKRNVNDTSDSPALIVASRLLALGAHVRVADPHVGEVDLGTELTRVAVTEEELTHADAVILLTDHNAFDRSLISGHAKYVLDTRHYLPSGRNVEFL